MGANRLLPVTRLPTFDPKSNKREATILIFGPTLSGKRTLARQLAVGENNNVRVDLTIRTREPTNGLSDASAGIDLIVVLVDSTSSASLEFLSSSMAALDATWFMGRLAVGVSKVDQLSARAFSIRQAQEIVAGFSSTTPCLTLMPATLPDASRKIRRLLDTTLSGDGQLAGTARMLLVPSSRRAAENEAANLDIEES